MPLFFLLIGILLVIIAINDKMKELAALTKEDFSLSGGGFAPWIVAVFVIGSLGYIKTMRPVANAFLVLIVTVMVLSNRGFFDKFTSAIKGK